VPSGVAPSGVAPPGVCPSGLGAPGVGNGKGSVDGGVESDAPGKPGVADGLVKGASIGGMPGVESNGDELPVPKPELPELVPVADIPAPGKTKGGVMYQ
jgi:hypothetical protein